MMYVGANPTDTQALEFFSKYWALITPIAVVVIGGFITGAFAIANRRGEYKTKARAPLPPTWPEMWARIDKLEERIEVLEQENGTLKEEISAQKEEIATQRNEKKEIFEHVVKLERLVPEPPPRPRWELHILPPDQPVA